MEDLIACEESYVQDLKAGIHAFSHPLRHCILTREQHACLFQNVEKLSTISEFHLRALKDAEDDVGAIYKSKLTFLCEAYETYSAGIKASLKLFNGLKQFKEFSQFVKVNNKTVHRYNTY